MESSKLDTMKSETVREKGQGSLLHAVHKFEIDELRIKKKLGCLSLAPQVQTEPQGQTD